MTRDIQTVAFFPSMLIHIVWIDEYDAATVKNTPIAIVQAINRGVVLVVTAERGQEELILVGDGLGSTADTTKFAFPVFVL